MTKTRSAGKQSSNTGPSSNEDSETSEMNISASTNSNQVQLTPSTSSTQPDAATILATLITMIQNGQIQIPTSNTTEQDSEEKKLAELDKAYRTPPFMIPCFQDHEKLKGFQNFKVWKNKLEQSLGALRLLPFIETEGGSTVKISPTLRTMLNAQTLQVIQASVTKHISFQKSAHEAYSTLEKSYTNTRMRDLVQLTTGSLIYGSESAIDPYNSSPIFKIVLMNSNFETHISVTNT